MVEELRIGGASDGPASFSAIRGIAVARNGNVFVVDVVGSLQIKLFDAAGRFIRNVGRAGGGPGEYAYVSAMLLGNDGHVHVIDPMGMRVLVFSESGDLVQHRSIQFGSYGRTWVGAIAADGTLLDPVSMVLSSGSPPSAGGLRRIGLRRIRPDGSIADTLPYPACALRHPPPRSTFRFTSETSNMFVQVPFLATPQTAFASDGMAWCAPRDEYVVVRLRIGTPDTVSVVQRNVAPLPLPRDTLQKTIDGFARAAAQYGKSDFTPDAVPRVQPVIAAIAVDDRNRLWVRRTDTPAAAPRFDLYDATGRELGTVQSRARVIGIPLVVGDVAYAIVLDADDVPVVVRARLR